MQFAKHLEGRLPWIGAYLSSFVSDGLICLTLSICPSCLSQMKISYILRMASLNTKQQGFFNISLESDLIMCFHIFSYRLNSTRLPEYSQKHQKYLRQTLTLQPLIQPKQRYPSISLVMFYPYTIFFAFFYLQRKSESSSLPKMFSGWFKKEYLFLIWVYLEILSISLGKRQIDESLTGKACLILMEERNCSSELQSYTQVTDQSSSSYYSYRTILLAILLNYLVIIQDHFNRYTSIYALGSVSIGILLVLF